eukprot:c39592_g1_i1.p1 GENE.c39592_g1_i1~~c39592_g1_i1.p1  ORF type:complete len:159 (+),score=30.55 c39592_g1_i1:47-478(+)
MLRCVAVIGKENQPLFIHTVRPPPESADSLMYEFLVYAALDTIEDKIAISKKPGPTSDPTDTYLGFLYPTEDMKLYGSVTNTGLKFIVAVDGGLVRETELKMFFKRLQQLYVETISNPFFTPGRPIGSKRFIEKLNLLVKPLS